MKIRREELLLDSLYMMYCLLGTCGGGRAGRGASRPGVGGGAAWRMWVAKPRGV